MGVGWRCLDHGTLNFSIESLGWDFELSFEGKSEKTGKYKLLLNGCRVEKLERAVFQREVPPLSKSTVFTTDTDTYKSTTYSPFVKGRKIPIRFE